MSLPISFSHCKVFTLVLLLLALGTAIVTAQNSPARKLDKINVFAVVSPAIEKSFRDAAGILQEEEGLAAFCLSGHQIHCTLYMTLYPENLQETILGKIADFAAQTKVFSISTTGLEITSGNWFFMNLERNHNLQTMCNALVELLAPLRAPSDHVPGWAKEFPTKVEYITKYGSPNVYDEFNPHLTFLAPSDGKALLRFVDKHADSEFARPITGQIIAIGAGIADRNGQIQEPLAIFPLASVAHGDTTGNTAGNTTGDATDEAIR